MVSSCKTINDNPLELNNQLIGTTSIHNARQLGGYRIGNKTIKKDVFLRSGKLDETSEKDSLLLSNKYKVVRIYDFRSTDEVISAPDVIPGGARHINLHISFSENKGTTGIRHESKTDMIGILLENAEHPIIQDMCTNLYDTILLEKDSQEVYRRFFEDLMSHEPEDGAVLWHCTQGKDRAGCASALLLAALGAERDLIMADFVLSKDYYDPMVSKIKTVNEQQRTAINTLISANPVIFEKTLNKIDEEYGSLRNYLTECIGVTPEMMDILRDRFLE